MNTEIEELLELAAYVDAEVVLKTTINGEDFVECYIVFLRIGTAEIDTWTLDVEEIRDILQACTTLKNYGVCGF